MKKYLVVHFRPQHARAPPRQDYQPKSKNPTWEEEETIVNYNLDLNSRAFASTLPAVCAMADGLVSQSDADTLASSVCGSSNISLLTTPPIISCLLSASLRPLRTPVGHVNRRHHRLHVCWAYHKLREHHCPASEGVVRASQPPSMLAVATCSAKHFDYCSISIVGTLT